MRKLLLVLGVIAALAPAAAATITVAINRGRLYAQPGPRHRRHDHLDDEDPANWRTS